MARTKRKAVEYPTITANIVWAAACAAQRVNGLYTKIPLQETPDMDSKILRPNKDLMREFMFNPSTLTDADHKQSEIVRTYWLNKLMDVLSGTANPFTSQAVELAGKDEFKANDWLGLATIAYLPFGYEKGLVRDEQKQKKVEAEMISQHFGKVGEKVTGTATVIESRYSEKWGTWYVTANFGTNVVLFAYRNELKANDVVEFAGTVKAHRENSVTQLNRVKIK